MLQLAHVQQSRPAYPLRLRMKQFSSYRMLKPSLRVEETHSCLFVSFFPSVPKRKCRLTDESRNSPSGFPPSSVQHSTTPAVLLMPIHPSFSHSTSHPLHVVLTIFQAHPTGRRLWEGLNVQIEYISHSF